MTLTAPAFAGLLYAFAGPKTVYFIISGLGFGAIVFTSLISLAGTDRARRKRGSVIKDVGAGLAYIKSNNIVLVLLIIGLATSVLAQPFRMLMPLFIVDVYELGPRGVCDGRSFVVRRSVGGIDQQLASRNAFVDR